ncbi:laccase [Lophiotrema nucula]|uniref:Laccase n=1 Tax=Lophiotrema nucula TaxID=690887 RepID=A0A6A5ZLH9_9PLEO|nr:laccase [Lophiotrema nucula]
MYSIVQLSSLAALLCTNVLAASIPSEYSTPEVAWKRDGLLGLHRKDYGGCKNTPTSRNCWTDDFTIETDMDEKWPETGNTVTYNFEITNTTLSPDGVAKEMMVVNGQYPGPVVEADWGDTIVVNVKNSLTTNGTGIHWHGLRQLGTNQMDGVGGITECPIAPGETRVYTFKATQFGSSWYHSHYSVQYGDGLVGGIIIRGPATANYDIDLGILPLTDWFHNPIFTVNAASLHAAGPPIADNYLVNGSMISASGGQYAVTPLTFGKKHLLRLVNTGINNYVHVALDGHQFTVVAADFVPVQPFTTDSLVLSIGQRYDVIIDACQTVGNYWLRVGTGGAHTKGLACDGPNANAANIKSIFRYEGAPTVNPNSTGPALPTGCHDQEGIVPYVKTTIPQGQPDELKLNFSQTAALGNLVQWSINDSPLLVDYSYPTLQHVLSDNDTFAGHQNVYTVGEKNKWQYWVIQQTPKTTPPLPHPIHLHGHDFYVLDHQANTTWTGDISRLASDNPVRRDTATLPEGGYLVLAFESDNPGVWLMHCHIPFHVAAGFGLQFLERESEIQQTIGNTDGFQDGCKSWTPFQTSSFPNGFPQGDSGV